MPMFPDAWMRELLSRTDFASLASAYVQLRPKGGRLWGCCPFHNEKTPSFSVSPQKQMYYCFGCHAGGGIVQFVMEMEKLPYAEAVKWLAQRAGMELPGEVNDEALRRENARRARIYEANRAAARFYHDMLMGEAGTEARAYLARRGVNARLIRRFGLGFAPAGWEKLRDHLQGMDFSREELIRAGLAIKGKREGECYDAFRNRVLFPIIDTREHVLGFGARTMGDETPKYLNTGDTLAYNKRRELYGLNLLKRKKLADIVVVEGYMDVIALSAYGVDNCVAGLGTAFTQDQARLLKRYAPRVYLCYDGDEAGQNATLRALDVMEREGLELRVISIPGGRDPDEYVRENGREAFLSCKEEAMAPNGFRLAQMAARYDMDKPDAREAFAREACARIARFDPVEQDRYIAFVAHKTGMREEVLRAQSALGAAREAQAHSPANYRHTKARESVKNGRADKQAQLLLACMMASREAAGAVVEALADAGMEFPPSIADFAGALLAAYMEAEKPDVALLISGFAGAEAEAAAAAQAMENLGDPAATARDCVRRMRQEAIRARIAELGMEAPAADAESARRMHEEITGLQALLVELDHP